MEYAVLRSVVFVLDKRMDKQFTEEKNQKIESWHEVPTQKSPDENAQNPDLWEAVNGANPYILPTKGGFTYWDCNWKCMQCRVFFNHLDEHWHDFHSDNAPKKQSVLTMDQKSNQFVYKSL